MMRVSLAVKMVWLICITPTAAILHADEPTRKTEAVKPPWQRLLQGEDANKAAEQKKKLDELQEAGRFVEALKIAEALAELRDRKQGVDHWQAVNARSEVETLLRALRANKEDQQSYGRSFALKRDVDALIGASRYREAQQLYEQVLGIDRKVLGEEDTNTAKAYTNLAFSLNEQGKQSEAEGYLRKALAVFRKSLGDENLVTSGCYINLAASLNAQGKNSEAEKDYRKALDIRRKLLSEEDPDTAMSYHVLGVFLYGQRNFTEAETVFGKALATRRKALGEDNLDTANSYNSLAAAMIQQGRYGEAEPSFRKALAIRRRVLGAEHPETLIIYNNLADNLHSQGKYREAGASFGEILAIRRKLFGEDHILTAESYSYASKNLSAQGRLQEAEEGLLKALAIRRKILGEDHLDTAQSYNNVAIHMLLQGKSREAEEGLRKAIAIYSKLLGENHPTTAFFSSQLAFNLNAQGKLAEAEKQYRAALAILTKAIGEDHGDVAKIQNNLALNLIDQRKYKEAMEALNKALAIRRKQLSEEDEGVAVNHHNIAYCLSEQGRHKEAEEDYRTALAMNRKALGDEHYSTVRCCNNLAMCLNAQGKYAEAEKYFLVAAESFAKARLNVASAGLERAAFTSMLSPLQLLAAVLARNGKPEEAWQRLEESLARGTWDDLSARLRQNQAERDKQEQIGARIDRLNQLIQKNSASPRTPEQRNRREELLGQLRQALHERFAFIQELEQKYGPIVGQVYRRERIQPSLPADTALLAWLDLPAKPKAADPNGEHWAIVLRSSGEPIWVRQPGTDEKHVWSDADNKLPAQLRAALRTAGSDWQPLAQRLRRQRFDPLVRHLTGVRRLIVLPSAALAGVPVESIADGYTVSYAHSGTMFAHLRGQAAPNKTGLFALADPVFDPPSNKEKTQPLPPGGVLLTVVLPGSNAAEAGLRPNDVLLRYGDKELNKAPELRQLTASTDPEKRVPVVVWRNGETLPMPLFVRPGKLGVVIAQEPAPQAMAENRRVNRLLASRGGDDGNWPRLPGTRFEVASLHRLFDKEPCVQVLLDSSASEQRLNELARSRDLLKYRFVHLATHGEVDNVHPLHSAVILSRDRLPDEKQSNELLLSGQPIPDGRLTAEEVLQRWNLSCDLVTLSACQTALGKFESGEGFVGFAQALILCGARSVCLSLWKVNDTATALLMERFYQNLLGKRDGLKASLAKAEALREAKEWLRTLPREEALKRAASLSKGVDRGLREKLSPLEVPVENESKAKPPAKAKEDRPYAHPRYWAGFILTGDPG